MEEEVFKLSIRELPKISTVRYYDKQTEPPQHRFWIGSGSYTKRYHEVVKVVGKTSINNQLHYTDQLREISGRHTNQLRSGPAVTSSEMSFLCPGHGGEGDGCRGIEPAERLTSELLSSSYYLLRKSLEKLQQILERLPSVKSNLRLGY